MACSAKYHRKGDKGRKGQIKKRRNAYETFKTVVGEIGRDRHEYLYEMRWWEILLIIQGYRRRNVLQYQLQRITAWASAFCMGNPRNKSPEDLFKLYCDDYITEDEEPPMTIEEQKELQAEMAAINASLNK